MILLNRLCDSATRSLFQSEEIKFRGVGGLGRPVPGDHIPSREHSLGGQCGELY